METISQKYARLRSSLKNGDFIAFSGTGIVATIIKEADNSKLSHVGRVVKLHNRWLIVDSNAPGNHPEWLSTRIEKYNSDADFLIIRSNKPQDVIDANVVAFIDRSDDERTRYDFKNGIKELLNRAFGLKLKIKINIKEQICSMSVRADYIALQMCTEMFKLFKIVLPQDYLRYRDEKTTTILN